jgi:hypothetical protein
MPRDYDPSAIPAVHNLQNVAPYREEPGFEQVVFRGIDQMIGLSRITSERPDSEPHTHPYEQMNMLVDGERVSLEPYDALTIPADIPHTSRAVDRKTATLLAFWPLREDRLDGTAYQEEFPEL